MARVHEKSALIEYLQCTDPAMYSLLQGQELGHPSATSLSGHQWASWGLGCWHVSAVWGSRVQVSGGLHGMGHAYLEKEQME